MELQLSYPHQAVKTEDNREVDRASIGRCAKAALKRKLMEEV